ncbi:MAG TPA: sulfatase-like hydrolase/transferase [Chryseolinea sp.]
MPFNKPIFARLHNDWHFLLLIIFFITHGYAEHTKMIPLGELALLFAILLTLGILLFWISKAILKDRRKAALFVTFLLAVFLFFGAFQDFLGSYHTTSFLAQLRVFFPLSVASIIIVFIILKKSYYKFQKLNIFLNALLALYIIVDIGVICFKLLSPTETSDKELAAYGLNATPCDTCRHPSIYFILLDEYSGSNALKDYFNYDNSSFEEYLRSEGFRVNQNTNSNYFYTVFSMASMLNMDYIPDLGQQSEENHFGYRRGSTLLADNVAIKFLQRQGYIIHNYSYFRLPGQPVEFKSDFLPTSLDLITNKTMYSRVANNLMRYLTRIFSFESLKKSQDEFQIRTNEAMIERVTKESAGASNAAAPEFTYMHLLMPHHPFAFDSLGNRITPLWQRKNLTKKEADDAYLQYLVYTNNRMRSLISGLKRDTKGQAVIILMSDHGFRRMPGHIDWGYNSLNAVYLPAKNYNEWYDGMSNVNQFRALFNTLFNQRLPMLKDSLVK